MPASLPTSVEIPLAWLLSLAPLGIAIVAVGSLLFAGVAWTLVTVWRQRTVDPMANDRHSGPPWRTLWCGGAGLSFACMCVLPSTSWSLATVLALLGAAQLATGLAPQAAQPRATGYWRFTLGWCLRFVLGLSIALAVIGWKLQASTSALARQQLALTQLEQRGGRYQQGHVQWAGATVRDADLPLLAELPPVTHLELGNTGITDRGLQALAPLSDLQQLSLRGTAITDEGLAHLHPCRQLRKLSLRGTAIQGHGFAALTSLPLAHVDLSLCPVSRAGLTQIATLPLSHLSLIQTKLSDADLDLLQNLRVGILEISATHFSPQSIAELREGDALRRVIVR